MKIVLLSTPTRTYIPNIVPPLGIMYIASYLEKNGHNVTIVDIAKDRQDSDAIIRRLKNLKPNLIGISGIITAFSFVKELVKDIKNSLPNIPVVIGGHIVIDNYELLLKKVKSDYLIVGYGEKALLCL